jgi:hypothetical protein
MTRKKELVNMINLAKERKADLNIRLDRNGIVTDYTFYPNELNALLYAVNGYDEELNLSGMTQRIVDFCI